MYQNFHFEEVLIFVSAIEDESKGSNLFQIAGISKFKSTLTKLVRIYELSQFQIFIIGYPEVEGKRS